MMQYERSKTSFLSLVGRVKIRMSFFLLLMLFVFGDQKTDKTSPTKSHREKFFRGRASSSSHLGEKESQELHSSHPWH